MAAPQSAVDVGLLLLTRVSSCSLSAVQKLLTAVAPCVSRRLYVAVSHPRLVGVGTSDDDALAVFRFTSQLYTQAQLSCQPLDVRLLLQNLRSNQPFSSKSNLPHRRIGALFVDCDNDVEFDTAPTVLFPGEAANLVEEVRTDACVTAPDGYSVFVGCSKNVVLGGTFDRIHNGHKILLSTAALMATDRLTCGVTNGTMLERKILPELMEDVDTRLNSVVHFLDDVSPNLSLNVVPIIDPFGPSTVDTELDSLLVSRETVKGGEKVNQVRKMKGLSELTLYVIDLADDSSVSVHEETKISSSNCRKRLLGTLLRPPNSNRLRPKGSPYVIGFTGGIASGKSHMTKYLSEFGCHVIDADTLAHRTYMPDGDAYQGVINAFGVEVVGGEVGKPIDRSVLGKIVFSSPDKRKTLENIVWPVMEKLIVEEINKLKDVEVVVIDAAVLLEAGWNERLCDEVWVAIISPTEAVQRIRSRDNSTEDQAKARLSAQISNTKRVQLANVVFCSLWEYDYTRSQVKKAFDELITTRLHQPQSR